VFCWVKLCRGSLPFLLCLSSPVLWKDKELSIVFHFTTVVQCDLLFSS